ncbi:RNA polymerase I-specific transcription initiation factor RRN3-like [Ctenocephalides felis]|nr:RNA polymerase I-specific transcription initiation factor RRN3-like [Ctenocephalides felis]
MERNERNNMAVMYGEQIVRAHESLDTFFPFDPYILSRSGLIVEDIYLKYESSLSTNSIDYKRSGLPMEEDDFLLDQSFNDSVSSTKKNKTPHKFSYGSSPGFKT